MPPRSCISFDSYIKPQPYLDATLLYKVVYLLIPTSNHNLILLRAVEPLLYIFWFLHQTTTTLSSSTARMRCISFDSYIKPQLSIETMLFCIRCISFDSYIKPQLMCAFMFLCICCISFDSYIKPQPFSLAGCCSSVVYLLIPTSNHNWYSFLLRPCQLYIFWFLHQTTTAVSLINLLWVLYIFWFLHQTTTVGWQWYVRYGCISFDSYIKPQLRLYFIQSL